MSKTLKEMEKDLGIEPDDIITDSQGELGVGQYGTSEDSLDAVNHPPHYTVGGIETLEVISAKLTKEQYLGYLLGNVMKYVMRHNYKGKPIEDLKKAGFYLERAITLSENK